MIRPHHPVETYAPGRSKGWLYNHQTYSRYWKIKCAIITNSVNFNEFLKIPQDEICLFLLFGFFASRKIVAHFTEEEFLRPRIFLPTRVGACIGGSLYTFSRRACSAGIRRMLCCSIRLLKQDRRMKMAHIQLEAPGDICSGWRGFKNRPKKRWIVTKKRRKKGLGEAQEMVDRC